MKCRRIAAAICAALLACALVCALVFICVEAHHDCHGEDCRVCEQLAVCRDALGRFMRVLAAVAVVTAAVFTAGALCAAPETQICAASPVPAGVKMLN